MHISGLGIAALVLGLLGLMVAWVPLFGMAAVPVAGIGLMLGIAGLISAKYGGQTGTRMPIAGMIVCGIAIVVAFGVTLAWEKEHPRRPVVNVPQRPGAGPPPDPNVVLSSEPRMPVLPTRPDIKDFHFERPEIPGRENTIKPTTKPSTDRANDTGQDRSTR